MAQNTPKDRQEISFQQLDEGTGRISNALSKAISYERTPSLFDKDYITKRDAVIKQLQDSGKEKKAEYLIKVDEKRRGKPVILTSYQSRIMHALSYAISKEIEKSKDLKEIIEDPEEGKKISRYVNITALTSLIFNSTRKRYKEYVMKELDNLSLIRQIQIFKAGDKKRILTAPLINIGDTIEDLGPKEEDFTVFIEITFGRTFFVDLNTRYATITPKLFEVWRKNGRGTELFSVLLDSIFSIYWQYRQAANKAEEEIRNEYKGLKKTKEDLQTAIENARREAMVYELNISTIKQRVTTNYDSHPNMKRKFKKDLENAINGFKELNLITDGFIQPGARGQEKVVFILSETYNFMEKNGNHHTLLESKTISNQLPKL